VSLSEDNFIPKAFQKTAITELQETPDNRTKGLKHLRKLITEEKSLIFPIDDDDFLLRFLRCGKFDSIKTFERVKKYYKFRLENRDLILSTQPSQVWPHIQDNVLSILPIIDDHQSVMFFSQVPCWDPEKCTYEDIVSMVLTLTEKALELTQTQINGVMYIINVSTLSMAHLYHITPTLLQKSAKAITAVLPVRVKGIYFVNAPSIFQPIFSLFRSFLGEKFQGRLFMFGTDLTEFHQRVNPAYLPKEVGGKLPTVDNTELLKELEDWEPKWLQYDQYGYK